MTTAGRAVPSPAARAGGVPAPLAVALAAVPLVVLLLGLVLGRGGPQPVPAGLPDPGPLVGWGLPVFELAMTVCAVGTVGSLLAGVVLAPGRDTSLSARGFSAVRASSLWAAGWTVSALVVFVLQMSDILGPPPGQLLDRHIWVNYGGSVPQGRSSLIVAACALVIAVAARRTLKASGGTALLLLSLAAVLPPAFTGHSASAASHDIATSSLVVHVLAATVWVGGLAGLVAHLRSSGSTLATAVPRFSSLALVCYLAVVASGVVNAWTRLSSLGDLFGSRYGLLVVGKVLLAAVLGWYGYRHRRSTVGAVVRRESGAFVRFATAELLVMGAAIGLAVALSRSPTPAVAERDLSALSPATRLLGYDVPPLTVRHLLVDWRPDTIVLTIGVLAIAGYVVGVRRLRAREIAWQWWRTLAFVSGVLVVVLVMCSGVATYAMAMFSVHMAQHMVLTMFAPVLLAMGAPVTLTLRALPTAGRDQPRGPREWLLAALHSRPSRFITQPVVALVIYLLSLYGLYFTPLFQDAMRSHSAHLLMSAHFLAVGILFFFPIIGADPMPRRLPHVGRLLLLAVSMPVHAFFGIIVMGGQQLLAPDWYGALALRGVDVLNDQQVGGAIAWVAGELPTLLILVAVLPSWSRSEEREAKRSDRRADADGDAALAAWNARLAALAARDSQQAERA